MPVVDEERKEEEGAISLSDEALSIEEERAQEIDSNQINFFTAGSHN